MADITVSVAAPGSKQAATEIRGVAQATTAAGQAAAKRKGELRQETAETERAAAAARKLAAEQRAAEAQRKRAVAAGSAAGGFGRAGTLLSLGAGSGQMTMGAASITAGMAVVGAAIQIYSKSVERSQDLTLKAAEAVGRAVERQRESVRSLEATALAAIKQSGVTDTQLAALGQNGELRDIANRLLRQGVVGADKGLAYLAQRGQVQPGVIPSAVSASRTGVVSFEEAVKIAAESGATSAAQILTEKMDRRITDADVGRMLANVRSDPLAAAYRDVNEQEGYRQVRMQSLIPTFAPRGVRAETADALTGGGFRALTDQFAAMSEKMGYLQKKADEQTGLQKAVANCVLPNGSLQVQVIRERENIAASDGAVQ